MLARLMSDPPLLKGAVALLPDCSAMAIFLDLATFHVSYHPVAA